MKTGRWIKELHANPIDWLLESNAWTRYRTMTDLLELPTDVKEVRRAKESLLKDLAVKNIIRETSDWMPKAATRNNDPKISYFKLRMLADIGVTANDKGVQSIYKKAIHHMQDGLFACKGAIPERPKKGEEYVKPDPKADIWHISPCNSPMITYALLALGFRTPKVMASVERLKALWQDETGWFCHFFFVESQFRREGTGCPIAGIMALEVFSQIDELRDSQYSKNAFVPIQFHKDYGKTLYYFGRSKKFWTFKYPFVWYNGLYLADVLSRFSFLKSSSVLKECIEWILRGQDEKGRYKSTSVFLPYKNWDFGNKKEPSPWITFLCCRILKRFFG
jgi:hypothetical protein